MFAVAGTGFQVPLVFRGKTYFVIRAGDAGGIFSPVARPHGRDQQAGHTDCWSAAGFADLKKVLPNCKIHK